MLRTYMVVLALGFSTQASAESISGTVVGVKQGRMMIKLADPSATMAPRTKVEISTAGAGDAATGAESFQTPAAASGGTASRDNTLGFTAGFSSLSTQVGDAEAISGSQMTLVARYGWNLKTFEVGPIVGLTSLSTEAGSATDMSFGAYGDYNFMQNNPGVPHVVAARGEFLYGTGEGYSSMEFAGGVVYKGFFLAESAALTASALYSMDTKTNEGVEDATVVSGIKVAAGIQLYF